jgi:hypothetical protein
MDNLVAVGPALEAIEEPEGGWGEVLGEEMG